MIKNLNYELIGEGNPAIVFLHGWGLTGSSFDGVINRLTHNQTILKLDFFSFGKSDVPEDWFDTYEYAYSVFLLLSELGLKEVVLVGHSFGGRIAIILSSIFDIRVSTIVLTSSAGLNRFSLIKSIKISYYKFIKILVKKNILSSNRLHKFGSDDYKKLDNVTRKVFIKVVNQDLTFLLNYIVCNVYLVWDKKDDVTPYWMCKKLYKNLISPTKIIFKNGKHFVYLHNIDKFSNLINSIL